MSLKSSYNREVFNRARLGDPETSKRAGESVKGSAYVHAEMIYWCLNKYGPMGKDQIKKLCVFKDGSTVTRRLPELQKMGLIEPSGKEVMSESGRREREWQVATGAINNPVQLKLFKD
jgi:DNA-binding MarR family transcriptional regulator